MFWGGVHTVKVRSQSREDPKAAEDSKMVVVVSRKKVCIAETALK